MCSGLPRTQHSNLFWLQCIQILLFHIDVGSPHFVRGGRFKIQHLTNELWPNSNKSRFAQDVRILNDTVCHLNARLLRL